MVVNPAQSRVGLTFNFKILPLQKGQVLAQKKYRQLSEDEDILLSKQSPPPLHPVRLDLYLFIIIFFWYMLNLRELQSHQPVAFKDHSPTAAD